MKRADLAAPRIVLRPVVLSLALAIGSVGALQSTASAQEYRGTWEQQMACTPDVWRLCSDQVPDVSRIVACLRTNTPQLSNNCRAVFESQANAQQPSAGRVQQQQVAPRGRAAAQPVQPQPLQPRPYQRPYQEDDE
ncbi:hypothetical protein LJR220_004614 [Bradyrhizobium sp. LjRoot220]|uniref:hypothetical protein n=1 Tax=Bradyrhizobium sp. LjRoot220 TaxID=3342284 RepID=UPI003ECC789B